MQVAPTFGDAPGVKPTVKRLSAKKPPAFHPQAAPAPTGPIWPEVAVVFCGPAQYKVQTAEKNIGAFLLLLHL